MKSKTKNNSIKVENLTRDINQSGLKRGFIARKSKISIGTLWRRELDNELTQDEIDSFEKIGLKIKIVK
jgi:hypothetical protein